ncbi:hypothetical protein A0H81_13194 [Grifola frondosa]|uniref:Uncharacterized protein n=1 Tax=Grifola frondosa TaxID=5627 RepID=A0A1C7LPL2_GRIFR|nr:hypothetical protein A0H81_13194 [Grifola frondosa]
MKSAYPKVIYFGNEDLRDVFEGISTLSLSLTFSLTRHNLLHSSPPLACLNHQDCWFSTLSKFTSVAHGTSTTCSACHFKFKEDPLHQDLHYATV